MNRSWSPLAVNACVGISVMDTSVSAVLGGSATCATSPAAAPSSTHACNVAISSGDSRGSSTQPKRGVQSGSSRASNGGIVPAVICASMSCACSCASL